MSWGQEWEGKKEFNMEGYERVQQGGGGGGGGRSSSSCAACKLLKRKCYANCQFAPYFRPDGDPKRFAKVHKVFGASNVAKILSEVPEDRREDAVNSLVYEAEVRLTDPVYGCIGAIASLQRRMAQLQSDLFLARARLASYSSSAAAAAPAAACCSSSSDSSFFFHPPPTPHQAVATNSDFPKSFSGEFPPSGEFYDQLSLVADDSPQFGQYPFIPWH
ncbi:unnamed protein product [Cuscuta campestris]|uniref:LOB domain-containing protein n=1 Tax=Cuscuta campestris TaxID=132261 RepID=A0A484LLZ6_9ASTE|nr:unnamed protein product [Cuscuta campestris]